MNSGSRFLLFIAFVLTVISTSAVTATMVKGGGGSVGDAALEEKIAQFVSENPEVIANTLRRAQQAEQQKLEREAQKSIGDKMDEIENDAGTPVAGNPKGKFVVVEFFDYNCGYCKKVGPDVAKLVAENKDVKVVQKHFPILGPASEKAAKAALAAYQVDKAKYYGLHKALVVNNVRDDAALFAEVEKAGYSVDAVKAKMDSAEVTKQLEKNRALGQAIGVRGTPTFIINGTLQRGAVDYNTLKEMASKKN